MVLRQYRRTRAQNGQHGQPPVTIEALRGLVGVCDMSTTMASATGSSWSRAWP